MALKTTNKTTKKCVGALTEERNISTEEMAIKIKSNALKISKQKIKNRKNTRRKIQSI